jgi:hypothetical protein
VTLERLERALDRARPGMRRDEQAAVAAEVLDALFVLGLQLSAGELSREDVQPVLDRAREKLALLGAGLSEIVENDPNPLASEIVFPDIYENRCVTRSGLQFAIDLCWDGTPPPELDDGLDRFDYMLEQAAEHGAALSAEDIPDAVPREHWWWRAPNDGRPEP